MHEATSFQSSGSENSSHSLNVERNASSALLVSEIFAQSAVSRKKIERTFKSELIRCNRQHRHDRETWFTSPVFGYIDMSRLYYFTILRQFPRYGFLTREILCRTTTKCVLWSLLQNCMFCFNYVSSIFCVSHP